jgi:hypothetical protein
LLVGKQLVVEPAPTLGAARLAACVAAPDAQPPHLFLLLLLPLLNLLLPLLNLLLQVLFQIASSTAASSSSSSRCPRVGLEGRGAFVLNTRVIPATTCHLQLLLLL